MNPMPVRARTMRRTQTVLPVLMLAACLACAQSGKPGEPARPKEGEVTRPPAVAGQFYPGDPRTLTAMVDSMLAAADVPSFPGRVVGIQVPHAGYHFSGPTAAHAFRLLKGMDGVTVVLFGTSHHARIDQAAVYPSGAWHTPLGDVPVDAELARAIIGKSKFMAALPEAHTQEHSIEVQLPFLQRTLASFKIVPIMFLWPSYEQCQEAGRAVAAACKGRNVVLVASTDLYHGESYTEARRTDTTTVGLFAGFDPAVLYQGLAAGKAQACGGFGVVAMMVAARELGADKAVVLAQTNSNDVTGERSDYVVGYSATAFIAGGQPAAAENSDELTEAEQQSLLQIARQTLDTYIKTGKVPEAKPLTARLQEKRGAFVTLKEHGDLRGCIGYVEAVKPLYLAVSNMAVAASTEDPRFRPVTKDELKDIDIEITVLSPLRPLPSPDSVIVGKHGLVIRKGYQSGLLLPQVPGEQGWNRQEYLEGVCRKAGLPVSAYKDKDAQLYCFTGQVFGEK